jgi:hypothetical protein
LKSRVFRIAMILGSLGALIQVLGAGRKWG